MPEPIQPTDSDAQQPAEALASETSEPSTEPAVEAAESSAEAPAVAPEPNDEAATVEPSPDGAVEEIQATADTETAAAAEASVEVAEAPAETVEEPAETVEQAEPTPTAPAAEPEGPAMGEVVVERGLGRVDASGTVAVKDGDDWRVVGQFPDVEPDEALDERGEEGVKGRRPEVEEGRDDADGGDGRTTAVTCEQRVLRARSEVDALRSAVLEANARSQEASAASILKAARAASRSAR